MPAYEKRRVEIKRKGTSWLQQIVGLKVELPSIYPLHPFHLPYPLMSSSSATATTYSPSTLTTSPFSHLSPLPAVFCVPSFLSCAQIVRICRCYYQFMFEGCMSCKPWIKCYQSLFSFDPNQFHCSGDRIHYFKYLSKFFILFWQQLETYLLYNCLFHCLWLKYHEQVGKGVLSCSTIICLCSWVAVDWIYLFHGYGCVIQILSFHLSEMALDRVKAENLSCYFYPTILQKCPKILFTKTTTEAWFEAVARIQLPQNRYSSCFIQYNQSKIYT